MGGHEGCNNLINFPLANQKLLSRHVPHNTRKLPQALLPQTYNMLNFKKNIVTAFFQAYCSSHKITEACSNGAFKDKSNQFVTVVMDDYGL